MHSGKYLMFPDEIDKLVNEWKTRVSKEIKYIWPASSKLREKYKEASPAGKQELIKYREERFYEDFRPRTNRRQAAIKQRATHSQGRHITSTTFGVSEMHIRDMVPNITGYEYRDEGAGQDMNIETKEQGRILAAKPDKASIYCEKFRQLIWQTGSMKNINITDCDGAHEIMSEEEQY